MANTTSFGDASSMFNLPALPSYTLTPVKPLSPYFSDFSLSLILPIAAYWILSMIFHVIDIYDFWPQYRLHTPAEILKRNHVSRYEVLRDVIIQQVFQTVMGAILGLTEPEEMEGRQDYDIARWATRLRIAQRALPKLLELIGLNAAAISKNVSASHPVLAGVLAGGYYPSTMSYNSASGAQVSAFTDWEMLAAKAMYWYLVPAFQFGVAIVILDSWQYFIHRAMHVNKWLYTKIHSRHHRLYVPYAYGALYNHPLEGFFLDTIGASLAYKAAGLTSRQGVAFFIGCTFKTVDDHCGYKFPWDPLQHITGNNAAYHDIHHQSWGIKTNFSQPFFTFWDRFLGTTFKGDTVARYARSRKAAQFEADADDVKVVAGNAKVE